MLFGMVVAVLMQKNHELFETSISSFAINYEV